MRQAALLRGVNLGKRKVIMSELRDRVRERGLHGRAHAARQRQSGARRQTRRARNLRRSSRSVILEGLELKTDVFVRDADQLDAIIAANPFKPFAKTNPNFLVVNFMRGPASAG